MPAPTPGPYEVEPAVDGGWAVTNGEHVLAVTLGAEDDDTERANAYQFAASFDMLAALEEAVDQREYKGFGDPASRLAYIEALCRAAIAKARARA
jgi:hypothetical protein